MPLVNPACATVRRLAAYGLIAHMNKEVDGTQFLLLGNYLFERVPILDPELAKRSESTQMYVIDLATQTAQVMIEAANLGRKDYLGQLMEERETYGATWERY